MLRAIVSSTARRSAYFCCSCLLLALAITSTMTAAVQTYPYSLQADFDHDTILEKLEQVSGDPLFCHLGSLSSKGSAEGYFSLASRPARIELAFYPHHQSAVCSIRFRVVDQNNYLALKLDIQNREMSLLQVKNAEEKTLATKQLPFLKDCTSFHSSLRIDDNGQDIQCTHCDLNISIQSQDLAAWENAFIDGKKIGLSGIGLKHADCRYVRTWSSVPDWDGRTHIEPMYGAQHIWTKVQQRFVGKHDRTYWGWCSAWGGVHIRWYDHNTQTYSPIQTIYRYPGNVRWAYDDHHPPGIYVHNDGRIWAWIQSHKSSDPFILLRSVDPESIDAWQAPIDMNQQKHAPNGGVYPRAHQVANGDVILFHRVGGSGNGEWHVRRSTDGGETWDNTKIINNTEGHVYQFIRQNPRDLDHLVLVGNHKDTSTTPQSWRRIYVWETCDGGMTFNRLDNKQNIALPAKRSDLEPVYLDDEHQLFVTGLGIKEDGKPLILAAHKNNPDHCFCAFYWQAGQWHHSVICNSKEWPGIKVYKQNVWRPSGGDVHPLNSNEICIAVAVDGIHEIQRWQSDDYKTWTKVEDITSSSKKPNFRPIYIENPHPDDWHIIWHHGAFYGTTPAFKKGRHFDRFEDVLIMQQPLLPTIKFHQ